MDFKPCDSLDAPLHFRRKFSGRKPGAALEGIFSARGRVLDPCPDCCRDSRRDRKKKSFAGIFSKTRRMFFDFGFFDRDLEAFGSPKRNGGIPMNPWLFLVSGISLLLIFQDPVPAFLRQSARKMAMEDLEIFGLSGFALLLGYGLRTLLPFLRNIEILCFFVWPFAYLLSRFRKMRPCAWLAAFALSAAVLGRGLSLGLGHLLVLWGCLAFLVFLLQWAGAGLRARLFDSEPPRTFSGLPVFLIFFAFLLLALEPFHFVFTR